MSIFANTDFRQIATAAIGALIVSTACVGAAVGPAKAATVASWQHKAEGRIATAAARSAATAPLRGAATASVAVSLDGAGKVDGARIVQSSGNAAIDREALVTAHNIAWPSLPGREAAEVRVNLVFGRDARAIAAARRAGAPVTVVASNAVGGSSKDAGLRQLAVAM